MRAVLIQNFGSSGTSLLHSLFDSHPQLLTLPTLGGHGFYTKYRQLSKRLNGQQPSPEQILAFARHAFDTLINPDNSIMISNGCRTLGATRREHCFIDPLVFFSLFAQHYSSLTSNGSETVNIRKSILVAGYLAYANAIGASNLRERQCLIFPFHSSPPDDVLDILNDFPDVKVVHMVRDPISMVDSALGHYAYNIASNPALSHISALSCAIAQCCEDINLHWNDITPLHAIEPIHSSLRDKSYAVRLEDLRADPERYTRIIAGWCDIEWHPSLLETTVGGKIWWNRAGSKQVAGFDKAMNQEFKSTSAFDRWRIAHFTRPIRNHFGYSRRRSIDKVLDAIALLASLFSFECERRYKDDFRAALLFTQHYLKWLPNIHASFIQSVVKASTARTHVIASRPDLHVLNDEMRDHLTAITVNMKNDIGSAAWRLATLIGRIKGYHMDRRYGLKMYARLRERAANTAFVNLIKAP